MDISPLINKKFSTILGKFTFYHKTGSSAFLFFEKGIVVLEHEKLKEIFHYDEVKVKRRESNLLIKRGNDVFKIRFKEKSMLDKVYKIVKKQVFKLNQDLGSGQKKDLGSGEMKDLGSVEKQKSGVIEKTCRVDKPIDLKIEKICVPNKESDDLEGLKKEIDDESERRCKFEDRVDTSKIGPLNNEFDSDLEAHNNVDHSNEISSETQESNLTENPEESNNNQEMDCESNNSNSELSENKSIDAWKNGKLKKKWATKKLLNLQGKCETIENPLYYGSVEFGDLRFFIFFSSLNYLELKRKSIKRVGEHFYPNTKIDETMIDLNQYKDFHLFLKYREKLYLLDSDDDLKAGICFLNGRLNVVIDYTRR